MATLVKEFTILLIIQHPVTSGAGGGSTSSPAVLLTDAAHICAVLALYVSFSTTKKTQKTHTHDCKPYVLEGASDKKSISCIVLI